MTQAIEIKNIRADRGELERVLRAAGAVFKGTSIKCPFHDDKSPSGSIYLGKDEAWRFKCHGCDICEDVIGVKSLMEKTSVGNILSKLRVPEKPKPPQRVYADLMALKKSVMHLAACHIYTNPKTKSPDMVVLRIEPLGDKKKFIQCRPQGPGFVMSAPPKPWPIYNRLRVLTAESVVVVEGEKCVEALQRLNIVATTSPGGAGNGSHADWSMLAGKQVALWPDFDAIDDKGSRKGFRHMLEVKSILERLEPPPQIGWIDPEQFDLPIGGDVVDYLSAFEGHTDEEKREAILYALSTAESPGAAKGLEDLIDDTITGKRYAIPWPWPILAKLSQALLPGTVTCICGDPGCGKSFLVLEAAYYWFKHGYKPSVYMLEEDLPYHLNRLMAQLDNNSGLTDAEWIKANSEEARAALKTHKKDLEAFAQCVFAAPDKAVTLEDLSKWIQERCAAGCQVIAIDPITAAETGDKRFLEDLRFMNKGKAIVRQYGARLVLMTHPRQNAKGWTDTAGGSAFPRFSQNVFWIHRHEQGKAVRVESIHGPCHVTINRSIKLGKTRNGRGAGLDLGFIFEGKSLRFAEQGIITKTVAEEE